MSKFATDGMWRSMLARSFEPRQWFDREDDDDDDDAGAEEATVGSEGFRMWVYRRVEDKGGGVRYEVGYYSPAGEWNLDSIHSERQREFALRRVNYLNGGSGKYTPPPDGSG